MAMRIRFQYPTGSSLGYSIERLSDGVFFDFASSTFRTSPTTLIASLPEDTGNFLGRYKLTLSPTPQAQFLNGDYVVTVHNTGASNVVVAQLASFMQNGDDSTIGSDPWSISLPGNYASGTAGAILGTNLDARVSSRSIYAGGAVASVTAPVTVGTNSDKAGYALASFGLDTVAVENGVNMRQALSPILAASAGVLVGSGTGTVVIKGGNTSTTRIIASTDNAGNRTSVSLSLPQ